MAEDNMDLANKNESNESPMDKGENGNISQTNECIQNYLKKPLEGEIKLAKSQETVACLDYKGKMSAQEYKLCKLLKAMDIHKEYFGVKNTISTVLYKQACLIDENVDAIVEKSTAVSSALDSSLDAIKEAKKKLWEVREAACKLDGARNDSCNSEQLSAMKKIPAGYPDNKSGIERFQALVTELKDKAYNLYDEVDDVFEKGVKVAGVQAYMNTDGLKEYSSSLKTDAEALDSNVEGNISYGQEQINLAQEAYTDGLQSLDTCLYAKTNANLEHLSLEQTENYAKNLEEKECIDASQVLMDICEDVKSVFQSQIVCSTSEEEEELVA